VAGILAPVPRQRADLLIGYPVAPGALLNTYASGTNTPLATFTDSGLGTPLANPIQADSAGLFPAIFLTPNTAYRFTLTDSLGAPLWGPQDSIIQGDPLLVNAATTAAITAAVAPVIQTFSGTGAVNNLALTTSVTNVRLNNSTLLTLSGFVAGVDGQTIIFDSIGAGQVDFLHASGLSSAANQLTNIATSGNTSLAPGGRAQYVYSATTNRWLLVEHQQGAWIARTFAAGNYTASAGTWTVASATRDAYCLMGRTLFYSYAVGGTTSGTPITVRIALPYLAAATDNMPLYVNNNGAGGSEGGYSQNTVGSNLLSLQRYANVAFAAGSVTVNGMATLEVQ
jgi:hypothetical protein